jgi:hypothetical protein
MESISALKVAAIAIDMNRNATSYTGVSKELTLECPSESHAPYYKLDYPMEFAEPCPTCTIRSDGQQCCNGGPVRVSEFYMYCEQTK